MPGTDTGQPADMKAELARLKRDYKKFRGMVEDARKTDWNRVDLSQKDKMKDFMAFLDELFSHATLMLPRSLTITSHFEFFEVNNALFEEATKMNTKIIYEVSRASEFLGSCIPNLHKKLMELFWEDCSD
ncbi:MAG: hypothetical protein LBW85_04640 [Deltaproteobacteria bacterium]|jgi:hypothetical protein|nr:hypothetical protein [Deltaproteobacteria bacterium]